MDWMGAVLLFMFGFAVGSFVEAMRTKSEERKRKG